MWTRPPFVYWSIDAPDRRDRDLNLLWSCLSSSGELLYYSNSAVQRDWPNYPVYKYTLLQVYVVSFVRRSHQCPKRNRETKRATYAILWIWRVELRSNCDYTGKRNVILLNSITVQDVFIIITILCFTKRMIPKPAWLLLWFSFVVFKSINS